MTMNLLFLFGHIDIKLHGNIENIVSIIFSATAPFHEDVQIITLLVHNQKINYLHMWFLLWTASHFLDVKNFRAGGAS